MRNWGSAITVAGALLLGACGQAPDTVPIPTPSTALPVPSASASGTPVSLDAFYDQHVTWKNCGDAECTHVQVPLDYADPNGPTIDLAVTRVRATGDAPLGSLFVNPGGPGGSAFDYAKSADFVVSDDVRKAYDIIGVDPRGVGKSAPVECMTDEERDSILEADSTPDTPQEEAQLVTASALPGRECTANAHDLTPHMGTVNAARDMDIVRQVVGDEVLNYLGKSYGTSLGAVYAELFPARVGRMVLDGVLPPDLSLAEVSLGQAKGFDDAVADFSADCSTQDDCPFRGDGAAVQAELLATLAALDAKPLTSKGRAMNEALATYTLLSYLYFPPGDYAQLRDGLNAMITKDDPSLMFTMLDQRISRAPDGRYTDNSTDAFYAVTCADNPGEISVDETKRLASQWAAEAPVFGGALAWGLLTCNGWPTPDAPVTAITAAGSAPILLVSTTHDPATPYPWGQHLADSMENAEVLTWDAHHHTAYLEGSDCIDRNVDAYLLRGTMPATGTVCS